MPTPKNSTPEDADTDDASGAATEAGPLDMSTASASGPAINDRLDGEDDGPTTEAADSEPTQATIMVGDEEVPDPEAHRPDPARANLERQINRRAEALVEQARTQIHEALAAGRNVEIVVTDPDE